MEIMISIGPAVMSQDQSWRDLNGGGDPTGGGVSQALDLIRQGSGLDRSSERAADHAAQACRGSRHGDNDDANLEGQYCGRWRAYCVSVFFIKQGVVNYFVTYISLSWIRKKFLLQMWKIYKIVDEQDREFSMEKPNNLPILRMNSTSISTKEVIMVKMTLLTLPTQQILSLPIALPQLNSVPIASKQSQGASRTSRILLPFRR
ncbi:hypothetical protein TIFTF001_041610 [Ficus carica]|uniref:Uncharacterized protein n=1 Tax=Ficus carica TaxID=3494 RepID=A0AA87Z8I7_FICCA|nr:hypothetical protein TIFTF001_041608 [Ficus carica]GMN31578.1 hypothetical protein TIFTF001_041610 [Ficus carica]